MVYTILSLATLSLFPFLLPFSSLPNLFPYSTSSFQPLFSHLLSLSSSPYVSLALDSLHSNWDPVLDGWPVPSLLICIFLLSIHSLLSLYQTDVYILDQKIHCDMSTSILFWLLLLTNLLYHRIEQYTKIPLTCSFVLILQSEYLYRSQPIRFSINPCPLLSFTYSCWPPWISF